MTKKFEAGKTYSIKNICGTYTYIDEFKVEEVNASSICGIRNCYAIDAQGNRYNGSTYEALTRVRKAPGKDYQMTCDLPVKFYAIEE